MPKYQPSQPAAVHADNVIWLDRGAQRSDHASTAVTPCHPQHEKRRQILTAMAGLDVMEIELLDACPQDRKGMYIVAARSAAIRSRRALHDAYPILAFVEPAEILYMAAIVRGADPQNAKATFHDTSISMRFLKHRRSRMHFESIESRSGRLRTEGASIAMAFVLSIPFLVSAAGLWLSLM